MSKDLRALSWQRECEEWARIGNELQAARPGVPITAYQISLEQRKRMLARGDRPMTYDEIIAEFTVDPGNPPLFPPTEGFLDPDLLKRTP